MPKKGQPPERYPVNSAYLAAFARRVEYVAKRYKEIAGQIPEGGEIRVTGRPTAEKSQGLLEGWLRTVFGC